MATSKSNGYVRVSQAATILGVSPQTVRNMVREGHLESVRTLGNHRRITRQSVISWLNGGVEDDTSISAGENPRLCIVARVSSAGQAKKSGTNAKQSSLENQVEILRDFVVGRYGEEAYERATKNYCVRGGVNFDDDNFKRLIKQILNGEFDLLIVKDKTRLIRFGNQLVEQICELAGCRIEYVHSEAEIDEDDDTKELASELLSIITHYTAIASGNKAKKVLQINMPPELVRRAYKLHKGGLSYKSISELFVAENLKDDKGRTFSTNVVRNNLVRNHGMLAQVFNGAHEPTTFDEFMGAATYRGRVSRKTILGDYAVWCSKHDRIQLTDRKVGDTKAHKGIKWVRTAKGFVGMF